MSLAASTPRAGAGRARLRVAGPAEVIALPGLSRPYRDPPGGIVERRAPVRALMASTAPLALLVAPAGYGKTMALASWADRDERPFAWLCATAADNDPAHLRASIARAMAEIAPPSCEVPALPPRPAVLVVDDAHALRARAALAVISETVDAQGAGSMVVLASRAEPALAVGRLRAEGLVLELGPEDLAMNAREAGALLRGSGLRLGADDLAVLMRRTGGWPALLRLAAIALRDEEEPGRRARRFHGDTRIVADYVADTVLAPLPPGEAELLLRVSPLDILSGPLCDAVTGRNGTGAVLRRLARAGVPLVALDDQEECFRLHGLVAEALRADLRRRDPAGEQDIHRRAGAHLERAGDLDGAIDHAIAAGDHQRAGNLLWQLVSERGRPAEVERWLHRIGDTRIAACPPLALAFASVHMRHSDRDETQRWTDLAERALDASPGDDRPDLRAAVAALRAAVARDGIGIMGRDAALARRLAPAGSPWHPVACHLEATAVQLLGDAERARPLLEEGARRAAPTGPAIRVLCLAQLALHELLEGDAEEGALHCEEARAEIARGTMDEPCFAVAFAVSAYAHARAGMAAESREDIATAHRLRERLVDPAPWYDAELRLALARAELRLGDAAAARELLGHAGRSLRRLPREVRIHDWVDDAWARADTFAQGSVVTPTGLTTAELRVLRFLPSHLSFREIAGRLHVSTNTVKTQTHAVYRKLDASSRSEAVARAREVGLVDA